METKLSFSNNTEKEVFEILSGILMKDINDLIKTPCAKNKSDAHYDGAEEREKGLAERRDLIMFLMKAKDAGELNDLHERFPTLNDIDEKYYECLSNSCNKLLKLSFNIIRATKKCIAYLKIYKSYIKNNDTNNNTAVNELNSMDYDLELINLIANQDIGHESDVENSQDSSNEIDPTYEDDHDEELDSIKEEMRDYDEDDDEYEEETINKKRKNIAKSLANSSKRPKSSKIVKVVIGGRNKNQMSDDTDEEIASTSRNGRRNSLPIMKVKKGTPTKAAAKPKPPPKKMYPCDQCAFKTVSRNHLKLHLQTHKKKRAKSVGGKTRIIKCKHCNFFASDINRISDHQKSEHNDDSEVKFEVPSSTSGANGDSLSTSLNQIVDPKERQKQCDKCPYKTSDAPHLKRHMNNHNFVENFFKCRYCDYYLSKRSAMIQHEIIHSEYKPSLNESWSKKKKQSCTLCPYKANKQAHLKDHVAKHEFKAGYLKCRYCDYYVVNTSALTQHEVIHPEYVQLEGRDKLMHSCTLCPYKADKPCHLAEHMLHHNAKDGYQKCRYCNYYVWSNSHMPQHEILHPEYVKPEVSVKLYPCSKCPYQAKTKMYLKSHEENHQFKQDFFKCRYCDFYLSTMSCMKRHEILHTNEFKPRDGSSANNTLNEQSLVNSTALAEDGDAVEISSSVSSSQNEQEISITSTTPKNSTDNNPSSVGKVEFTVL